MSIELKIKQKHLALEPHVIKHEERKLKSQIRFTKGTDAKLIIKLDELVSHRRWNVRNESRATHLARAYLEGKPYSYVEKKRKDDFMFRHYIVPRVVSMVTKYGSGPQRRIDKETIIEWSKIE